MPLRASALPSTRAGLAPALLCSARHARLASNSSVGSRTIPIPNSLNGGSMPVIGLGTWMSQPPEVEDAVHHALKVGYRHIDTARIYSNEPEVGTGLHRWLSDGGKREDVFLTSKLWNSMHLPSNVPRALDKTLSDLRVDYLDLYLIHWPVSLVASGEKDKQGNALHEDVPLEETWAAMEELLASGKVKHIGISNYRQDQIEATMKSAKHMPDVLQIELHPYLQQRNFVEWAQSKGIVVQAYSPFGNLNPGYTVKDEGRIVEHATITAIAKKLGKTPAQVILAWNVARNVVVLPKSVTPDRITSNLDVPDLSADHVEAINKMDLQMRYCPGNAAWGHRFD